MTKSGGKNVSFAPTRSILGILKNKNNIMTMDLLMDNVNVHSDITRLPFASGTFDVIFCSHVLEHISDDIAAISELHRVLDRDGYVIIMVAKDKFRTQTQEDSSIKSPKIRESEFRSETYVRPYGPDFSERLHDGRFIVSVITYGEKLDNNIVRKQGLEVYYLK